MIYHVAPADHSGDLESLYSQHGDDAYDMYAARWEDAGDLAQYHAHYVHCYDTLAEAQDHCHDGKIYAIDDTAMTDDYIDIDRDILEFDHPIVRDSIPAQYLVEVV